MRRVIQIAATSVREPGEKAMSAELYALCNDGSMWVSWYPRGFNMADGRTENWLRIKSVPLESEEP